jgi:uncharacterized protein (TIGR02284 family)
MDWQNLISVLNGLLESVIQGERVLRACMRNVGDARVRKAFETATARCEEYADELERKIRYLGGELQRGLTITRASSNDRAILAECEDGEDIVERTYKEALKRNDLPVDIRIFVARQHRGLQENHDCIQSSRQAIA